MIQPAENQMTTAMKQETTHPRAQVLLPSGRIIDLAAPKRDSWTNEDLAVGLARTYRWGGHSKWARPLTVAQHSLTVLAIRQLSGGITAPLAAYELLHDAEEGLIGFDCIAPLKKLLGEPFARLSKALSDAITARYDLPALTRGEFEKHKAADKVAAATEALQVVGWSRRQIISDLEIAETPLTDDPLEDLAEHGGFKPWEPWPSEYAAQRWLETLESLTSAAESAGAQVTK